PTMAAAQTPCMRALISIMEFLLAIFVGSHCSVFFVASLRNVAPASLSPPAGRDGEEPHQVGVMPTRAVNDLATTSLPSTSLSGSAGNARVAGPSTIAAPSRGL